MYDTTALRTFGRNLLRFEYREVMMTAPLLLAFVGAVVLFPGPGGMTQAGTRLTPPLVALLVGAAVAAGIVKGMSGFGYALTTTPVFASVVDPTVAVVALAVPPWVINAFQVGETNTGTGFVRRRWPVLLLAVVGAIAGVTLLARFSTGSLVSLLVGGLLLCYVAVEVVTDFVTVDWTHRPAALGATGFMEGLLLGTANLGPLLPPYYHTFLRDVDQYVGSLSMIYGAIFSARIVYMFLFTDLLTPYRLWVGCVVAVVAMAGLAAGTALRRLEIDEERFNWVVTGLLFLIALNLVRGALG